MIDEKFLELSPAEAKNHALGQPQKESARLSNLYLERHAVDLLGRGPLPVTEPESLPGTVSSGGWWLAVVGGLGAAGSFFFPVSVPTEGLYGLPSQVANIDLIATRHMILASALSLFISGCVLIAAGAVQRDLRRSK